MYYETKQVKVEILVQKDFRLLSKLSFDIQYVMTEKPFWVCETGLCKLFGSHLATVLESNIRKYFGNPERTHLVKNRSLSCCFPINFFNYVKDRETRLTFLHNCNVQIAHAKCATLTGQQNTRHIQFEKEKKSHIRTLIPLHYELGKGGDIFFFPIK